MRYQQTLNHGSQPLKPDPRDKSFTQIAFGAATLPIFPKTLNRLRQPVKNQGNSESCTKHATELTSGYQEEKLFSAAWAWMQLCKSQNSYLLNGADPRAAMGINCKKGSLLENDAQFSFPGDPQQLANWNNWINVEYQAEQYEKAAYVHIPRIGDWFDSIRTALLNGKEKKQVVMAFGRWLTNWFTAVIPKEQGDQSGWHAYTFIDFDTIDGIEYLVAQNSYGNTWGDNGFQYFPREVINREFALTGTGLYVFIDLSPAQINLAKQETAFGRIQRTIIDLWWQISQRFGSIEAQLSLMRQLLVAYQALRDALIRAKPPLNQTQPINPMPTNTKSLTAFCEAIRDYEGAPGDRNYRNNNPGNCRYSSVGYASIYGHVGRDPQNFAIFKDYEMGFLYLKNLVLEKVRKHPNQTILDFMKVYAPASDNNDPVKYAAYLAKRIGVTSDFPMKNIV